MRRCKLFVLGLLYTALSAGQTPPSTTEQQLLSHNTDVALQALKKVADSKTLYQNPSIQSIVIRRLNRESMNPNWGDLAEMQSYEDYYGQLLDTTKVIAAETHNRQAWVALVAANYNAAPYGLWLAQQPEAIPVVIEQSDNKNFIARGRAIEVMGYVVAACIGNPSLRVCAPKTKDRLLSIIRQHAATDPGSAVVQSSR